MKWHEMSGEHKDQYLDPDKMNQIKAISLPIYDGVMVGYLAAEDGYARAQELMRYKAAPDRS